MKHLFCILAIVAAGHGSVLLANNIAASNAVTTGQNTTAGTNAAANYTLVEFDLSWGNSWRASTGPSNWDAAWVFVKFMVGVSNPVFTGASSSGTTVTVSSTANLRVGMPVYKTAGTGTFAANTVISSISSATTFVVSVAPSPALSNATISCQRIWEHASLDATAGNHTAPATSAISVPSDSTGAFIYRSANGTGTFSLSDVQLRWVYGTNGVRDDAVLQVKVFAIETVWVPQGSFVVGSGGSATSEFYTHTTNVPFQISSENQITVGTSSGNLYYPNSSFGGDQAGPIPAAFPKGYAGFYCMKYEISQGDYRDFLNTLTYTQQTSRAVNVTGIAGTEALSNTCRNGIDIQTPGVAASFTPAVYACNLDGDANYNEAVDGEWIACTFLSWMDGCAYVDWAGLRPMTELEYEKACRGDQAAVSGEYAWGSASITGATGISNDGANNETFSNAGANCAYNYSGGVPGPLRVGAFAGGATTRAQAGATYYGIMEMSGNLWDRVVTIGKSTGRNFTGLNGNGQLSPNGHANQSLWPQISGSEVTGADGSGFRGGDWSNVASYARVSDRNSAANTTTIRSGGYGFRGVRVFP
ncbi:MAG: SUMF1/EgtB/PvdO family nonheme iron enzyme [Bacteroidia bacterium]